MERRNVLCWSLGTCVLSAVLSLPLAAQSTPSAGYAVENGDVNGDQERDLSDPVYLLGYLFSGSEEPVPLALCGSEATVTANGDSNGDGTIDVSDPILLLGWLFSGGPAPVPPCGEGFGAGSRNLNPRVIPVNANAYGRGYGAWSAEWWKWFISIPTAMHPALDPTGDFCGEAQSGKVFYLAADFTGTPDRPCTIPAGRAILFAIVNTECSTLEPPPFFGSTEEELRDCAKCWADQMVPSSLEVTLDGVALKDLASYRVESPLFTFGYPADNIFGIPAGPGTGESVSDGYWVLLAPLSAGVHTLSFSGLFNLPTGAECGNGSPDPVSFGFGASYVLTVE